MTGLLPGGLLLGAQNPKSANKFFKSAGVCSRLPDLSNGRVNFTGLAEGYKALYICDNENHTVIGDRVRTCMSNGMWSGQEPICEGMKSVFVMTYITI